MSDLVFWVGLVGLSAAGVFVVLSAGVALRRWWLIRGIQRRVARQDAARERDQAARVVRIPGLQQGDLPRRATGDR